MKHKIALLSFAAALLACAMPANADVVTDWNLRANELVVESKLGTPPAMRVMAITQTAVLDAVTAARQSATPASVEAAVAAANRATLAKLVPAVQASLDRAYESALAALPESPVKSRRHPDRRARRGRRPRRARRRRRGLARRLPSAHHRRRLCADGGDRRAAVGPAQAVADDERGAVPPRAAAGARQRHLGPRLQRGQAARRQGQHRPHRRADRHRRFWEYSLPPIYHGVVQSVAGMPGRDVAQNARLFAAATQALDDGLIAVFEAKYVYNFWRPVTAIRNGDVDGNPATERDASWTPLHDAPMHPEYPSAHATLAGAVGAVLKAELAGGATPVLVTSSPSAKGATRRWKIGRRVREGSRERARLRRHPLPHFGRRRLRDGPPGRRPRGQAGTDISTRLRSGSRT